MILMNIHLSSIKLLKNQFESSQKLLIFILSKCLNYRIFSTAGRRGEGLVGNVPPFPSGVGAKLIFGAHVLLTR
jgi:hypothetical protein